MGRAVPYEDFDQFWRRLYCRWQTVEKPINRLEWGKSAQLSGTVQLDRFQAELHSFRNKLCRSKTREGDRMKTVVSIPEKVVSKVKIGPLR